MKREECLMCAGVASDRDRKYFFSRKENTSGTKIFSWNQILRKTSSWGAYEIIFVRSTTGLWFWSVIVYYKRLSTGIVNLNLKINLLLYNWSTSRLPFGFISKLSLVLVSDFSFNCPFIFLLIFIFLSWNTRICWIIFYWSFNIFHLIEICFKLI